MYNVLTPAGIIKVATLTEAIEYQKLYGYPYQKIISAPETWREPNLDIETDAMGNCFSDADPGL
jgi:hypothetical protein